MSRPYPPCVLPTDLRKFLGDLGVPSLPGGFLDVLSYFSRGGTGETDLVTGTNLPVQTLTNNPLPNPTPVLTNDNEASLSVLNSTAPSNGSTAPVSRVESNLGSTSAAKGKAKEVSFVTPQLSNISRMYVSTPTLKLDADISEKSTSSPQPISRLDLERLVWPKLSRPSTMRGCSSLTTISRGTNG